MQIIVALQKFLLCVCFKIYVMYECFGNMCMPDAQKEHQHYWNYEFKVSLFYKVSSRTVRATQGNRLNPQNKQQKALTQWLKTLGDCPENPSSFLRTHR